MFIDGAWEQGRATFAVTSPIDGSHVGDAPDGGAEDARRAVAAAHAAFPGWAGATAYERASVLQKAHALMLERREELARTMTSEMGKPIRAARIEVGYGADFLAWYAEEAKRVQGHTVPSARRDQRFLALRQPVGVVAAITPWNYPVSMIARKFAPALAAGCTIVLKPAEATPLCAIAMMRIFEDAGIPSGVVNLVTCSDPAPVGEVFVSDPRVRKLTFTGSTAVGRMLAGKAAANMKRVSCELGGHAPFLVFADADPVHAAKGCQLVKFLNTGQACISPNRIFVSRDNLEPFVATLAERVTAMTAGSGFDEKVAIGPLVNETALDKMVRQVEDARAKGAQVVCGGHRLNENGLDRGFFFAPTVLTGVTPDMAIYREETFGPIAPIIAFDDEKEAVAMANDTHYGLAAYIYTRDIARAWRTFEALDFGIIGINDINPTSAAAPFGGMKDSGLGREGGAEGIDEYLETKLGGFAI